MMDTATVKKVAVVALAVLAAFALNRFAKLDQMIAAA
jgi:hypothetical protein